MPPAERDEDQLAQDLGDYINQSLLQMWKARDLTTVPPGCQLFPKKRMKDEDDGVKVVTRVSEQESKIIATQWLRRMKYPFSIETPTELTYWFKKDERDEKDETDPTGESGGSGQSALTDVTVYRHDGDSLQRFLNIELKAHQPEQESFRKDIEKLLREGVEGMWFHTLESANQRSWDAIGRKLWGSYKLLAASPICSDAWRMPTHALRFKFIVLKTGETKERKVEFAHWRTDLTKLFPEPPTDER